MITDLGGFSVDPEAAIVLVCVFLGVPPLFLLNGQTFTNSLIALCFFLVATALCTATAFDRRSRSIKRGAGGSPRC